MRDTERTNLTIGVLGGMGPEATAGFFSTLVSCDVAKNDQDHLHMIVDSTPSIPDRTTFLLGRGPDPLPGMLASAKRLEVAGVDIAGIPCMTAHAFLPRLTPLTPIRFLSAFEEMMGTLTRDFPSIHALGILATSGSKKARLYETHLDRFLILWPNEESQETCVMEAIYGKRGIKAGEKGEYPRGLLIKAAPDLQDKGAEAIVAGCTEVPLALSQKYVGIPFIDPMTLLAKALVAVARNV